MDDKGVVMKLKKVKIQMHHELTGIYDVSEIDSFFYLLIDFKLGISKTDFILNPEKEIETTAVFFFNEAIDKLKEECPIQYIIGETEFYGLVFKVTNATLIPRPETEELVDWIVSDNKDNYELSVLDIGTGSGCIPISLAKNLNSAVVTSIDVSDDALRIAKLNAKNNNAKVKFICKDILRYSDTGQKYDVIVSNPPYVRVLEKLEIKKNVMDYEPHLALFVSDDDPLVFYRKIVELSKKILANNGVLYFEINQYLGEETVNLIKQAGFKNVILKKDMSGNDRMIKAYGL